MASSIDRERVMQTGWTQRRSSRLVVQLPMRWCRGDGEVVATTASDVNEHGMYMRTAVRVEVGTTLKLEVVLPSGPIPFVGVARFCGTTVTGAGIGIEIDRVGPSDRER